MDFPGFQDHVANVSNHVRSAGIRYASPQAGILWLDMGVGAYFWTNVIRA